MKVIGALVFSLFAPLASAQAYTHFEQTLAMYDSGSPIASTDLEGAFAGRCFAANSNHSRDENDPMGALLTGRVVHSQGDDSGPAFPQGQDNLIVNLVNSQNGDIHYRFDNWTEEQAMATRAGNGLRSTPAYQEQDGSQSWSSDYSNGPHGDFSARMHGNFIVVSSTGSCTTCGPDTAPYQVACYFYKRLP